ncbi:hypothetical protein ACJMK2_017896 [Sinanodonta woodiana]|uniref:Uncharacterized protein n=1 Tax=Sinanodonta woodiana TaxID=1069815 RepID=A0ABD3UDD4_SINWO
MSDGYRPLSEAWRLNTPEERQRVGQRKLEELQEQIRNMESQMDERRELIHKLKKLQEIENDKKQIKGKILERQSRNSSQRMLLGEEMERLFGRDSARFLDPENPLDQKLVQDVIQHRTKEFSLKQQEAALQTQFLAKERERLLEARQRVQQKREALYSGLPLSDQGRHTVPADAPRNIESLIRETVHSLPDTVDRIWKMREDLDKHYQFYQKPYKGEMGIRSYEYWQIPDYFMVKSIVDELVEDFLNHYLQPDDGLGKETHSAMIAQEMEWMKRQSDAISERKAVQLVLEEMVLDETGKMVQDVVQEMSHMYGTFRNMADDIIMSTVEAVTTGNEKGRDPSDPTYNLVTKGYFSIQENRNRQRKDIWDHSQQLLNKLGKKKIKYKKVDEKGREVVVEEEEEDILADTDVGFNSMNDLSFHKLIS